MNQWANDWVKYHTGGQGNYVTTGMEDTGTLQSLTFLSKAGRVDLNRIMVLRTASDYDQQHDVRHLWRVSHRGTAIGRLYEPDGALAAR